MQDSLESFLRAEIQKYEMWAFMENHGGTVGFHSGYLQSLRNTLEQLKKCEQLTLF